MVKITMNKAALDKLADLFTRAGNAAQVVGNAARRVDPNYSF